MMSGAMLRALPYLAGAAVVVGAGLIGYSHGVDTTATEWEARMARKVADIAKASAEAERLQRSEEQRRQAEIEKVRHDAREQIEQAAADAAAAHAAADGLREHAKRLAARASQACSSADVAGRGQAASAAGMVLADVLARADERAGELAAAYDRARAAGLACERAYDGLTRGE